MTDDFNPDDWHYAKQKYYTYQAAIRQHMPGALSDPVIAAAVAQIDMAYLAIDARMDQLCTDGDGPQ